MRFNNARVVVLIFCTCWIRILQGCNFYPVGEYLRFVRIPENLQVGGEVLKVEVHPRKNLSLQPVDDSEDAHYFTYRDVNRTHVSVILAQTLETLVDADNPQNVLKFRMGCDFEEGEDMISAYLSVTVYVEDVNDHTPTFMNTPYEVSVDELTPVGLTIYKAIHAFDRDKPNTPNSDVQYSLIGGDHADADGGHFALDSSHKAALVLAKRLNYDQGDREFTLVVMATDRGSPPRSANTSVHILVQDNDDLSPKFTEDVYRTQIPEFYPLTGQRIHKELLFERPIIAFDQDLGLDAPLRYDIISGNERHLFSLDPVNASLFLNKEIDLDAETTLSTNTFVLQIQAAQIDNPLKTAQARVEVEILDLNDNLPEFEVDFYNISIVENLPNGFSVLQVMASDKDQGDNGEYTYQLDDPNGAFSIDPRTGWLTVRDQNLLDRERHTSLKMKVFAREKNPSIVGSNLAESRSGKWNRGPSFVTPHSIKDNTLYIFPDKTGMNNENVEFFGESNQIMSYVNVEVTLLDANDNNPIFLPSNLYEFSIKSNSKVGFFIGRVKAVDPDLGRNGIVLYGLQRTSNLTVTSPFQVDAQSGSIFVAESPLVEGRHALFIEASDQPANPSERRYTLAVVSIDVLKPNKGQAASVPVFQGAPYEFWVGASVGVGTSVGQIRLTDASDDHDVIYDLLHTYDEGVPFAVEERSGTITVLDNLSKFTRPLYDFEAIASLTSLSSSDESENATISTNVTIHVVDVTDERGVLMRGVNSPIVFHVKENLAGAIIGQLLYKNSSTQIKTNSSKNIRFFIANQQDVTDDIAIGQDGTLFTQKALDREKRDIYRLTIIAEYNKGLVSGAGIYQVTIQVDDENDNSPIFKNDPYEGTIYENSKSGARVNMSQNINAIDVDLGNNALFSYNLVGDGHELFDIDQVDGRVYFVGKKLDREERSIYALRIIALDKGNLSSETKLTITVLDMNDNMPVFIEINVFTEEGIEFMENYEMKSNLKIYGNRKSNVTNVYVKYELKPKHRYISITDNLGPMFSLPETISIGTCLLQVEATDKDSEMNGLIKYKLTSETYIPTFAVAPGSLLMKHYFMINEGTGQLVVTRTLPPESEFRLIITAADGENHKANLSIRIFVKDINDHLPMFKKSWYSFDVDEALYSRRVLGKIDAIDADFGQNANITYFISSEEEEVPFEISPLSGVFSINGELDRESKDRYDLQVIAIDNGLEKKLSSTVNVEVHVTDVNDNAPKFYGFDEILEWKHPEAYELINHNFESVMIIPVYKASLLENSPIGTVVTRVFANDTDFTGNGNGLLLFNIPQRKNQPNIFSIDSKDGIVTLTGKLDYEMQIVHNVTIVASDLGSPSLSSTAMLVISVIDVPEELEISNKPVFVSRYYEVEIEENSHTPVELLSLNLTEHYEQSIMKYSIVSDNKSDLRKMFVIDPRNGTLYLVRSPDRETKDTYEIIVRAERQKVSRNLPHMLYPISDEVLEGLSKFEVKIVIKIKDVNDNAPKFKTHGRPIVTAIPTTAAFGYQVIKLEATDIDMGVNADIRYQIINDAHGRFAIDPRSGDVRAAASFARDGGRVFGFDVKATDKRGADDGKSAIANVFVYVLDERAQTVLVMGSRPADVERALDNITQSIAAATGYDVRVRKLEAHHDARHAQGAGAGTREGDSSKTDMYIYAVDPLSNAIIDTDTLQKSLFRKESELKQSLSAYKLVSMGGASTSTSGVVASRGRTLSVLEAGVLALGCLVFVGALVTAVCVLCLRKSRRRRNKSYSQQRLNGMAFSTEHLTKLNTLFPSGGNQCQELSHSYSEADSYIDVLNAHNVKQICHHGNTIEEFGKAHQKCLKNQFTVEEMETQEPSVYNSQKHDKTCIKFNQRSAVKRRSITGLETSMTSVHSSGQDSGIAEGRAVCACGHSNTQTSEESTGSYEDSLKSQTRPIPYHLHHIDVDKDPNPGKIASSSRHGQLNGRRLNHINESFIGDTKTQLRQTQNVPALQRIGSQNTRVAKRQMNPKLQKEQRNIQNYKPKHIGRRPLVVDEPTVDYDHSESEDVPRSHRIQRNDHRSYSNHNYNKRNSKLLELSGQAAVFVATPAAAAIMRRQGSERLVISRPIQ